MGQSLFKAVKSGDLAAVEKSLESLVKKEKSDVSDINQYDLDGFALIHWAAKEGYHEACSWSAVFAKFW